MRAAVLLLAVLAALPLAAARPDLPDPSGDRITVGPCVVGWSFLWPGETVGARCDDAQGNALVGASYGTCALGSYVYVTAAGHYVLVPCRL